MVGLLCCTGWCRESEIYQKQRRAALPYKSLTIECGEQSRLISLHCMWWRALQGLSQLFDLTLMHMQIPDSQPAVAEAEDELPKKALPAATKKRAVCFVLFVSSRNVQGGEMRIVTPWCQGIKDLCL